MLSESFLRQHIYGTTLNIPSLADARYLVLSLCLIFGASIFFVPLYIELQQSQHEMSEAYGQSLANSAARESVEAVFRNDLVGLRAITQSIADNPFVLRASMRTIDQQTLVQAGPVLHDLPEAALTYEASVTLQDSMAAIVSVTVAMPHSNQGFLLSFYLLFIAANAVLMIAHLIAGPLKHLVSQDTYTSTSNRTNTDSGGAALSGHTSEHDFEDRAKQDDSGGADEEAPLTQQCAYLSLCVKNVTVLKHQLNGETFRNTFQTLAQKINSVGRLYGLTESHWETDRYLLCFKSHDQQTALFNAACTGRILLDLIGIINRVPLDLSAEIAFHEAQINSIDMPFVGLAIDTEENPCDYLDTRVEYLKIDEHENRQLISKFLEPYADLLNRQMEQFKNT